MEIGQNAQWEHLFSMYFDDLLPISLIFWSQSPFDEKMISQWEHQIPAITCDEGI